MNDPTSLKQLIQSLAPEAPGVIEGIVTSADPLEVTLMNDSKMVLGKNSLVVPRSLTDYMIEADFELSAGVIDSKTTKLGGKHTHEDSGEHDGHNGGEDGKHTHEDSGEHIHKLETFSIKGGMLHLYNALKKGDRVYLLAYNGGKKYYILDRKG